MVADDVTCKDFPTFFSEKMCFHVLNKGAYIEYLISFAILLKG